MMEKTFNLLVYCWFLLLFVHVRVCMCVCVCVCVCLRVCMCVCPVVSWYLRKVRGSEGFLEKDGRVRTKSTRLKEMFSQKTALSK